MVVIFVTLTAAGKPLITALAGWVALHCPDPVCLGYIGGAVIFGVRAYRAWKTKSEHASGDALHCLHSLMMAAIHAVFK